MTSWIHELLEMLHWRNYLNTQHEVQKYIVCKVWKISDKHIETVVRPRRVVIVNL